MSYLLDTHTLLWARLDPMKLSAKHREVLENRDEQKFISALSIWEISLKFSLGKLHLGGHTPEEFLESALSLGFKVVEPSPKHYASFHSLPVSARHKDPFDRMLIWQAIQNKLVFISSDTEMPNYKIHGLRLV